MKRKIIPYNPALKEKARYLRNNRTTSEIKLWKFLKGRQMMGYDFHRQKPLGNYIVDFFCNELMLTIAINGISHIDSEEYDVKRQKELESMGINFLQFEDDDVFYDISKVLHTIEDWIRKKDEFDRQLQ